LLQRSQVTSLFGAEVLWSKGYTGAKVKMAIFDIGIQANHPHFQNIKVLLIGRMCWSILCLVFFFFLLCEESLDVLINEALVELILTFEVVFSSVQIGPMRIR
jgi:hypothetical protein